MEIPFSIHEKGIFIYLFYLLRETDLSINLVKGSFLLS